MSTCPRCEQPRGEPFHTPREWERDGNQLISKSGGDCLNPKYRVETFGVSFPSSSEINASAVAVHVPQGWEQVSDVATFRLADVAAVKWYLRTPL